LRSSNSYSSFVHSLQPNAACIGVWIGMDRQSHSGGTTMGSQPHTLSRNQKICVSNGNSFLTAANACSIFIEGRSARRARRARRGRSARWARPPGSRSSTLATSAEATRPTCVAGESVRGEGSGGSYALKHGTTAQAIQVALESESKIGESESDGGEMAVMNKDGATTAGAIQLVRMCHCWHWERRGFES